MTLDISEDLLGEFKRISKKIGDKDEYKTQQTLGIHDVLKVHFVVADFFLMSGEGLSSVGTRDIGLLHSALLRPHVSYHGKFKWEHPVDKAATLFYGIIKDHPFFDANKRTALLSLLYNLSILGLVPTCKENDLEDFAVLVSDDRLEKYSLYKNLRKKCEQDVEVKVISWYIKKNTRRIDNKNYTITYHRLKKILNKFGFDLKNPSGNTIDIVRVEEKRKIFGLVGPKERIDVKVAQIGFPSWTKEVGAQAIKTVRQATGLTPEKGFDSATFYNDEDPVHCLMAKYQRPLIRLAFR